MHSSQLKLLGWGAYTYAALSLVSTAQAQTADADKPSLETITVTARRTEESIQSVPVSESAFSNAMLREKSISTPEDIQTSTPGVMLTGSGGGKSNSVYQIRGQSKALSGTSSPAVISYFAEVPDPNYGSFTPQYDMGSIQVLKGPQGTLFGRNTTGGAILFSPAAPTHEFEGYVSATLGNYNNKEWQGAINIPIAGDIAALRIAGDIHKRDGYSKDLRTGGELDAIDSRAFRVSLLLQPTDFITNNTIFDYYKSGTNGTASVVTRVFPGPLLTTFGIQNAAEAEFAAQRARGVREVNTSIDQFDDLQRRSLTNRTEIGIGPLTLINIFGYRDIDLKYLTNVDGNGPLIADGSGVYPAGTPVEFIKGSLYQYLKQTSDELQLRGKAFNDNMNWLVGAFYLKNEPNGPQSNWVSFGHIYGTPQPVTTFNFVTEESKAAFAHLTYQLDSLLQGLQFEVGARYTKDKIESCTGVGVASTPGSTEKDDCNRGDTTQVVGASVNSAESSKTTWSVGLNWQITPDVFAYLVSRKGYRAGGINAPTFSGRLVANQAFAPETVTDGEVGLRADWYVGDVTIRTNISGYVAKYKDVQAVLSGVLTDTGRCVPGVVNPPGISPDGDCNTNNDPAGGTLLANLGESRVSGTEFEVTVVPLRGLSFNVGGSIVSTKTTKFAGTPTLAPYVATTEVPFNYTPSKSFIAGARYDLTLNNAFASDVIFNADYYWTDDIPYVDTKFPSYSLTNFRIDFDHFAGSDFNMGLFVKNAFDKDYISTGNVSGVALGLDVGLYGPPRMYGMELRYKFGGK